MRSASIPVIPREGRSTKAPEPRDTSMQTWKNDRRVTLRWLFESLTLLFTSVIVIVRVSPTTSRTKTRKTDSGGMPRSWAYDSLPVLAQGTSNSNATGWRVQAQSRPSAEGAPGR